MTVTDTAPAVKRAGARCTDADNRAAALAMMRADAVEYVTSLFDWLDEGQAADARPSGGAIAGVRACLDATEKKFPEVLAGIIKSAEENGFGYEYFCTEEPGCKCLSCRYPAEDKEDMRMPWTILMANVRERERARRRELQEARATR
jgi:hypothetical protein